MAKGEDIGKNPKKKKNEKEVGLVVSQQTVIRNQGLVVSQLSLLERDKKRRKNVEKEGEMGKIPEQKKKQKRIRPNGSKIGNLQIKLSASPSFGAERTLTAPFLVTSSFLMV